MRSRVSVILSAADLDRERPNLERGAIVAAGVSGLAIGTFCDVDLSLPSGEQLSIPARVVLATEAGTVLALDAAERSALAACVGPGGPAPGGPPEEAAPPDDAGEDLAAPASVQERLRGLTVVEQLKVAREGTQTERVVLERLYGKTVWEALLRNTHLTVPEVARLSRMGTMPRPLLELIVANPAWLQAPQVRRALLSNPRLSTELLHKVLAALPREELRLVPQNTAYPAAVRSAAKLALRR